MSKTGKTLIDTQLRNEIVQFLANVDHPDASNLYTRVLPKRRGRITKVIENV